MGIKWLLGHDKLIASCSLCEWVNKATTQAPLCFGNDLMLSVCVPPQAFLQHLPVAMAIGSRVSDFV